MADYQSVLPPRTINYLRNLTESDRKVYASQLLGSYQEKALKFEQTGERMAQEWVINQGKFFEMVCDELRDIIETGDAP